jgi:hypothetical protein
MNPTQTARVESASMKDFAKVMRTGRTLCEKSDGENQRLNLDQDSVKNGLGQLVLTVEKLLHELLERQAIRRMEADTLTDREIERLGGCRT